MGTSKVNPVYSKMPGEKGFMQSRDAMVDPAIARREKLYLKLEKLGFLFQIELYQ
jgi:hypothetical protein